jgi:DNA modification methylase
VNPFGPALVVHGDAANLLLPDECVDLIVTSPPYFGLRSYQDGGEHYEGQVGDEPTPAEYLDALIACTREWVRVLRPGGSIFVNLGDKYANKYGGPPGATSKRHGENAAQALAPDLRRGSIPEKSLMLLPQRYAIRCTDELGLICRAEVIWAKPNGLPESVTDRVRRSHEHVFHFVKQPRYYSAVDEIREEYSENKPWGADAGANKASAAIAAALGVNPESKQNGLTRNASRTENPLGKLPGSVWSIPTAPLRVPESLGIDHFAAYPPELVRRIVLGWSPLEVCTACGEGRRPVVERVTGAEAWGHLPPLAGEINRLSHRPRDADPQADAASSGLRRPGWRNAPQPESRITGYGCACPAPTAPATPGVVLDPFGGTGTTALVASCYGRVGISVDLSADYCRLARWRTTDPGQRASVLGVAKPAPPVEGQLGMFDELGA